jgi:hypothetical protein
MCPKDYVVEQLRLQQEKERERIRKEQEEARERIQKVQEKDRKRHAKQEEKAQAELDRIERKQRTEDERELARQNYRGITIDLTEEDTILETILNAERMEALNTQPCPKCRVKIEKNGGCTHMHCSRCDHDFTWSTVEGPQDPRITSLLYHSSTAQSVESIREELNKKLDTGLKYIIFKIKPNVYFLLVKVSEDDEKVIINNRSFIGSAIVKRVKPCPNVSCQKLNVKMGDDNWIVCKGCLEQYCFLCTQPIKGLQHFQKRCDRHT